MMHSRLKTTQTIALVAEMQAIGIEMMRRSLSRRHPNASDAQVDEMLSAWLGATPQPRDIGGDFVLSRQPRFASHS